MCQFYHFVANVSLPRKKCAPIEEAILRMADSPSVSDTPSVLTMLEWEMAVIPYEHIIFISHKFFPFFPSVPVKKYQSLTAFLSEYFQKASTNPQ